MSEIPGGAEELVIALRLATTDFKKDIKEAERDIETFTKKLEEVTTEMGKINAKAVARQTAAGTQRPIYQGEERRRVRQLTKEAQELNNVIDLRNKEKKSLKDAHLRMRGIATLQKHNVMELTKAKKLLFTMDKFQKRYIEGIQKELNKRKKIQAQLDRALKTEAKKKKKAAEKAAAVEAEANKSWFTKLKEKMRLYSVFSKNGVRMITTMRGAAGVALGVVAAAGQVMAQQILQGLRHLVRYEAIARNIAFIQAGQTGAPLTELYSAALGAYTKPGGTQWPEAGITRTEGAGLDVLNLKSGLEFSKEQMVSIATLSKFINEESTSFMTNLINYIKIFGIEKEAFDDTINSFAMISGMSMGGSGEIGQGFDYLAGLGRKAKWDPMQFLTIQKEMIAAGRDTSRFWRALSSVMAKVIEDDSKLVEGIRGANKQLRSLDEILWILDESYDKHEGSIDSSAWAFEMFGARGAEAIEALGIFVDDLHETNSLVADGNELQAAANKAAEDTATIYQESVAAKLAALTTSIENFQLALANLLAGPLKDFMDVATDLINELAEVPDKIAEAEEVGIPSIAPISAGADPGISPMYQGPGNTDTRFIDWMQSVFNDIMGIPQDYGKEEEPEEEDETGPETPESPPLRGAKRSGSIKNVTDRRSSSQSSVTHNYITIMDNDSMLRGLLGVNLNV